MRVSRRGRERGRILSLTGITRHQDAWSAHLTRGGETVTGWFSDNVWGGRDPAKLVAQYFRDETLQIIEPDVRARRREQKKSRRRRTGVVGVCLEPHRVGGRLYERYVAMWPDGQGGSLRRRFLVQRYGREEARRLAIRARRSGLAETRRRTLARQREEAAQRLRDAPPKPRQVKDPRDRKGINMGRRRPRRKK